MIHYHNFEQGWFHPARSISLMAVRLGFVWLSLRRVHICLRHPQPLLCCCFRLPILLTSVPLDCVRGPLLLIEGSGDQRRAPRGSQCAHVRGGGGTSGRCPGTISIMNTSCKLCTIELSLRCDLERVAVQCHFRWRVRKHTCEKCARIRGGIKTTPQCRPRSLVFLFCNVCPAGSSCARRTDRESYQCSTRSIC